VEDVMLVYAMHTSHFLFYATFFRLTLSFYLTALNFTRACGLEAVFFSNSVVDIMYKTLTTMA